MLKRPSQNKSACMLIRRLSSDWIPYHPRTSQWDSWNAWQIWLVMKIWMLKSWCTTCLKTSSPSGSRRSKNRLFTRTLNRTGLRPRSMQFWCFSRPALRVTRQISTSLLKCNYTTTWQGSSYRLPKTSQGTCLWRTVWLRSRKCLKRLQVNSSSSVFK